MTGQTDPAPVQMRSVPVTQQPPCPHALAEQHGSPGPPHGAQIPSPFPVQVLVTLQALPEQQA